MDRWDRGCMILGVVLIPAGMIMGQVTIGLGFLWDFVSLLGVFLVFYSLLGWPDRATAFGRWVGGLRRLLQVGVVMLLLSVVVVEGLIYQQSRGDGYEGDYLVVLGAGLYGETPSLSLISRLDTACAYMLAHPTSQAVLSGGQGDGESITEAEAMRRYLVAAGIDQRRLMLEERSVNTRQNLMFSKGLLAERGVDFSQPVGIVTNDFHLYRAKKLAQSLDIVPAGLAAPTPDVPGLPLTVYLREYFAVGKMYLQALWLRS